MKKYKLVFVGLFFLFCMCYINVYSQVKNIDVWEDELIIEGDGFRWIETTADVLEKGEWRTIGGAKDKNGKVIIPLSREYDYVTYSNMYNKGVPPYFKVKKGSYIGACTIDGRVIVAPMYGLVTYDRKSDVFVFQEYEIDPKGTEEIDTFTRMLINMDSGNPCYSLGVSLTKKGEPYISNNKIVSNSDFYTPYTAPKSYKGSYTSSSAPILNGDNLATGLITVLAGAFIVAGISDLFGGSSKAISSSSNNNNSVAAASENVMSMGNVVISRADLYEHNILTGKFDHIILYLRNNNNKDVFVNVEMKVNGTWKKCSITYDDGARTETLNGSYGDNRSEEIHLRGNATRVVEVTSYSRKRPSAVRITRVF